MIIYLEIEESGCIDKSKLLEELRARVSDLAKSEGFPMLERIVVKSELLSSDPYISPR